MSVANALPPLTEESNLPEGWAEIRISDYFDSWGGMTPSTSEKSYWDGKVPWVSSKDIKRSRVNGGQESITQKALKETRLRICPVGSVLVVVRSGILAHTLPIAIADAPLTINQDLKAFWCHESQLNEWLAVALRALAPKILGENRKDGTTVQSVRYTELCDLAIAVPPPLEQKRIVEKVEQLLARVNAARERLARVPAILNRFRQAVLAAACTGNLTAAWREQHPHSETASDLLSEIAQLRSRAPNGTRRTTSNRESDHINFDLPDCPEAWVWTTIRQVAEVRGGIQKQPKRTPKKNAHPYLRVANVLRDRLDLAEIHMMELFEGELETYRLKRGDVLIVEGNGSLNEIGRSAIWAGAIENCVHQNHIIRVRAYLCSPEYLNIYWNSPVGRANVAQVAVTTSGLYSLSTAKIANLPVAIPSLAEQQEIVRRVGAMFSLANAIEKRVATAIARVDKLTQAILAKAFRGELVPTEAKLAHREGRSYEPASALLVRIRQARTAEQFQSPTATGARRGRRKTR